MTPLVPSWADPLPSPQSSDTEQPTETPPDQEGGTRPPIPAPPEPNRFWAARANFTRFVASGGTDRQALGRALGAHVRTVSGGSRNAARRMGASSRAAANLLGALRHIERDGVAETLRALSLEHLTGRSPKEILAAFTDAICSPGGSIDEGIARNAYVETVLKLTELGESLDNLTEEQIAAITIDFISRSIVNRVINDIGMKLGTRALTEEQANSLEAQLNAFVVGTVRDRLQDEIQKTKSLETIKLNSEITRIYEVAFTLLEEEAARIA